MFQPERQEILVVAAQEGNAVQLQQFARDRLFVQLFRHGVVLVEVAVAFKVVARVKDPDDGIAMPPDEQHLPEQIVISGNGKHAPRQSVTRAVPIGKIGPIRVFLIPLFDKFAEDKFRDRDLLRCIARNNLRQPAAEKAQPVQLHHPFFQRKPARKKDLFGRRILVLQIGERIVDPFRACSLDKVCFVLQRPAAPFIRAPAAVIRHNGGIDPEADVGDARLPHGAQDDLVPIIGRNAVGKCRKRKTDHRQKDRDDHAHGMLHKPLRGQAQAGSKP